MSGTGLRKSALFLSSLPASDREQLLAALPTATVTQLRPLIATIARQGWSDPELVGRVLAEEIRGLTAQTALSVDALLAFANTVPADWTARVLAANTAIDPRFLVSLLDKPLRERVESELQRVPRMPPKLREAILAEAVASIRHA